MKRFLFISIISAVTVACSSTLKVSDDTDNDQQSLFVDVKAPYLENGWTEEEAIHYIIDKFTYGHTDALYGEIEQQGINAWLTSQLNPKPDKTFNKKLENKYPALKMSITEIGEQYPGLVVTLRAVGINRRIKGGDASMRGSINFNEMFGTTLRNVQSVNRKWFYEMEGGEVLKEPIQDLGLGNFMDLMYQLQAQKLYRATYSPSQLEEKMIDFWFNHFNVSITRINDVATNVLSYERDAIRPHTLGYFSNMLKATAQHPAMLTYLDNTNSDAPEDTKTLVPYKESPFRRRENAVRSINENYARELFELHTLGVDGGYTQKDVEEVARIFTGWKTSPLLYPAPAFLKNRIEDGIKEDGISFTKNGFYFNARTHDVESKIILGKVYPAGKGVEEGYALLEELAAHSATSQFIATKMATYFLNDNPDKKLVNKMALRFCESGGNIKLVLKTMIESPEFWKTENQKAKAKSPFEFLVSTLRKTGAEIGDVTEILRWVNKMGQPLFSFQPPTGYPTEVDFWINEAAIAQRIKYSYLLTKNKIDGVRISKNISDANVVEMFTSPEFQQK